MSGLSSKFKVQVFYSDYRFLLWLSLSRLQGFYWDDTIGIQNSFTYETQASSCVPFELRHRGYRLHITS